MKPHYFALCTATCLVVLCSGHPAAEPLSLASAAAPFAQLRAPVVPPASAAIAMAYAAGVVDFARQQTLQTEDLGAIA